MADNSAPNGEVANAGGRSALIAELEQISAQQSDESPAASVAEESATPDPVADAAGEPVPAVEAKPDPVDPVTQKRLDQIQKQEKRQRELIAKERAEFEAERAKWQAELDAAREFADLRGRAKYDPAGILAKLGVTEDDFEPIARDLYARSKAGREKPENREAALRMQQQREYADKVAALEQKLQQFEAKQQEAAQRQEWERAYSTWYGGVTKAASSVEAPLLQAQLAKNPARAEQAIQAVAAQLHQQTGEWPDADDVITAYEAQRRAELEELGIPLDTIKRKPAANGNAPTAPAKTMPANAGSTTQPKPTSNGRPSRDDMLRELERLEREQAAQSNDF